MRKVSPLITLACVVGLVVVFLAANAVRGKKAVSTANGGTTPSATATALHALFAGRSSGNEVAVAIAVNDGKAVADLTPAAKGGRVIAVQGTVNGGKVTLTGSSGAALDASISGTAMFGTVTLAGGQQGFPFSAEQTVVEAVYAGRSSGNQVGLAIVTKGDTAAGYVCNGRTVEAWLQGTVKDNQVTLTGSKGAALTGFMSGLDVFGTVTPAAGMSFPFSAALSSHPAGVYQARIRVNGLATRIGWAVLPDGSQLGVAAAGAARHAAPPLDLSSDSFTIDGTSFKAAPVTGNEIVVSQ